MSTTLKRILLVESDAALRGSLAEQLALMEQVETVEAATAEAALQAVEAGGFDAVLLEEGLPDMDGRDLCRTMRGQGLKCPVIMLTASAGDAEAILGQDCGASDYVAKPIRLSLLLTRLRAHLRQSASLDDDAIRIGPYRFQPASKLLLDEAGQRTIRLTEKEADILRFLHCAGARTVGRETLLGEVWGYNAAVTTHTLETHVYRLRRKIERDPAKAEILVTEPGGYRLAL
ncbi:response regulator transcription factor [Indioceanicola profundi]|uniref:response regulator transcription factor n=1 Tax=Indioceanicola profundi TaxID=2220096 RepID=UPI000E6AC371|nr:response regulator transcription factor [Indioceanicola profundi]